MELIDTILLWTAVMTVIIAVGGVIALMIYRKGFNYKIQIRRVVNGRKLISEDRGRIITDGDKNKWLKRLKAPRSQKLMPLPPEEAQELDMKGTIHVIANLDEKGNYQFVTDNTDMSSLDTLNSNQRLALTSQIKKAQSRKSFKWQEHIPLITSALALVIIIISFMVFFGEVLEPIQELGGYIVTASASFEKVSERLESLENNIQQLADEDVLKPPEEAPQ